MRILHDNTIALFIDIQEKLFPHIRDKERLEQNLIKLGKGMHILEIPVLVTEQYRKGLGITIPILKPVLEGYPNIEKTAFSCCDEPDFMSKFKSFGKELVIICGIETHVCVLQTAMDLLALGYRPIVIEDCVSSRKDSDKAVAIHRMRQEGVIISSLESILFELTRFSGTEKFKLISSLVK